MRLLSYVFMLLVVMQASFAQTIPTNYPGAVYNTTPPSLANKQSAPLQSDTSGNLKVNLAGSSVPITTAAGIYIYTPTGYCKLSVTGATATLTSSCAGGIPVGTQYALVCNEGSQARWRNDGPAPTTSLGQVLGAGDVAAPLCTTFQSNFTALSWIEQTGSGTATLDISFYR